MKKKKKSNSRQIIVGRIWSEILKVGHTVFIFIFWYKDVNLESKDMMTS